MMGELPAGQNALFYDFCLEDHVPHDHLLRQIDPFLDLSPLREHLSTFYSSTGRPSIAPELLIRMLIIGYCFGIRSERRLCDEVHLNLAYRWFCRLGLEAKVPDHSTFSENRHGRFRDSDTFRMLFEDVVSRCLAEGLIGGEGFAIDASVIKADASAQRGVPGAMASEHFDIEQASRPVREYLHALDTQNSPRTPPKSISLTDPQARWTAAPAGPAFYAYSTNYLVDIHNNIIVDVEPTPAFRIDEVNSTRTMINRVEQRLHVKPKHLIGDMAYGSAPLLDWLVEKKHIEPHTPVWDKMLRSDDRYSNDEFIWHVDTQEYHCPRGHTLHTTGTVTKDDTVIYRSRNRECAACPDKQRCCPNTPNKKIARSIYETSREVARRIATTAAYRQSRKDRKKVEMLFAHLKRILKLDRLRLRGLTGAHDEFLLAATAQNLRRLAKLRWKPPPDEPLLAPIRT
jgi:transposase